VNENLRGNFQKNKNFVAKKLKIVLKKFFKEKLHMESSKFFNKNFFGILR
jgi:hypothetical protein